MTAPALPRRITVLCPRCEAAIELNVSSTTRLTFTTGSGGKGWITCEVGVSAIEHRCDLSQETPSSEAVPDAR